MLQQKPTGAAELGQFVSLGDVARGELRMQCQYASRYVDGSLPEEYPDVASGAEFGKPLRLFGDPGNYHSYMIHQDDVDEFVRRVKQYRNGR